MKKLQFWMAAIGVISSAFMAFINYKVGNTDLAFAWLSSMFWALSAFISELNNK